MEGTSAALFSLLMMSFLPALLPAKGITVKITIKGAGLTTALDITDPKVGESTVWDGPGTFRNHVEATDGFIIDWSKGIVARRPAGLQHYEVSFYSGCEAGEWGCRTSEPSLCYVVFYDYDPSKDQGYIYLPGGADELSKFNADSIWHGHGFEGNWFLATSEWEHFVRPRIAKARATGPSR